MFVSVRHFVGDVAGASLRLFRRDERGQIAILFGLAVTTIVLAAGGGIDFARAYQTRQKLSQIATLACQYASRPNIIATIAPSYSGSNGSTIFDQNVRNYVVQAFGTQQIPASYNPTTASFTFSSTGPADISLSATVPTAFMKIVRINQMPIGAIAHCLDSPPLDPSTLPAGLLIGEGFEKAPCSGTYCFIKADGTSGTQSTPSNTFPPAPGYTGSNGQAWYTMGYCLEIDSTGTTLPNGQKFEGGHGAELDCDNGSGSAGNSSITTKTPYLTVGNYELRYDFGSRVPYPDYDPAYICGTTADDVAWANSSNMVTAVARTNQINVYFDLAGAGGASPGTHTTIDKTQQLAGVNLIDVCVQSMPGPGHTLPGVERSVRIYVTTPGFYWLTFAADGQNDSYGGQVDNIRFCSGTCTDPMPDNFPWPAGTVLFNEGFENPKYTPDFSDWIAKTGNLNSSNGVTVGTVGCLYGYTTSALALPGWPCQPVTGWATGPVNQINYILKGTNDPTSPSNTQYISMDGYNKTNPGPRNRVISRPFLLDPGYYQVSYQYISDVDLSPGGYGGSFCYNMPSSGSLFGPASSYASSSGLIRFFQATTANLTTNLVGVFMANGQLISTPIGGGALDSTTKYLNTDGSTSVTPTFAPDRANFANYDSTVANPILDICNYSSNFNWITRTAYVKIQKPGNYWLTFSANGGFDDGNGGGIDDVKLTALGGLSMSSPPVQSVTIPVPGIQPDTPYYGSPAFNGFYIVANPLTPPAAPR